MAEKELSILVRAKNAAQAARDITKVDSAVQRLGVTASRGVSALGTGVTRGVQGAEKAVGHLKHRLAELATPLAAIGLTAGIFSITGAFDAGIHKAEDMALAVEKLTGVTGLSAHAASQLVAVFGRFGIETDRAVTIAGFAEKAIGKLALTTTKNGKTTSKLADLEKRYGIVLRDNKGHAVDFATELGRVADYYNSNHSAGAKAALAAQLFGKGYAALIPVLKLGSKGIEEVSKKADELGLTLKTTQDVQNVKDFIAAQRDAGEAVGGLEVQLGLLVMPDLAAGLKNFTHFLETHQGEVHQFFSDALHMAEGFAGFLTGTAVPAVAGLASAASAFWDKIPAPLRDLLFKGVIADRTINFLFGISPIKLVASFAEGALTKGLGGILGGFAQRGSSPANPVFVSGGLGGGGGLPGAAGSGIGIGTGVALGAIAAAPVISALASADYVGQHVTPLQNAGLTRAEILAQQYYTGDQATQQQILKHAGLVPTKADFASGNAKLSGAIEKLRGAIPFVAGPGIGKGRKSSASVVEASRGAKGDSLFAAETLKSSVKQGVGPDMEALRGKVGDQLAATQTAGNVTASAARAAGATAASGALLASYGIIAAVRASQSVTNVKVDISASDVSSVHTVTSRYGPTGSDRNSSARQLEGIS